MFVSQVPDDPRHGEEESCQQGPRHRLATSVCADAGQDHEREQATEQSEGDEDDDHGNSVCRRGLSGYRRAIPAPGDVYAHPMFKLTPAPNAASRTLRDNALVGFGFIVIGLLAMTPTDNRFVVGFGGIFLVLGLVTLLPSLIARGIQLERDSRESP